MTPIKWEIHHYAVVGSTNDEAQKFCTAAGKYIVVRADSQTAGRGRRGRQWKSLAGNLFFSLALEFDLAQLGALVQLAGLAVLKTVQQIAPPAAIKLKWPNDVLLNGAKVCGMLLEKGAGNYMIVGIGVNIAHSPQNAEMLYKATSLAENGIITTAADFLADFLPIFSVDLAAWRAGRLDLTPLWLANAAKVGGVIEVRQNESVQRGIFAGVDENANLLLQQDNCVRKITAGDVFYVEKENDGF